MLRSNAMHSIIIGISALLLWMAAGLEVRTAAPLSRQAALSCDTDDQAPLVLYPASGLSDALDACSLGGKAAFFFSVTVTDNCDPAPIHTLNLLQGDPDGLFLEPLGEGNYLAIAAAGDYLLEVEAQDSAGNEQQVSFPVNVDQAPAPEPGYACNDTINLTLQEQCQRLLTPDMLLEGEIGCTPTEFFDISVADEVPENGALVDDTGFFNYSIEPVQGQTTAGFTGSFAPARWSTNSSGSGSLAFTSDSLLLEASGAGTFLAAAVYTFDYDGTFSAAWSEEGAEGNLSGLLIGTDGTVVETISGNSGSFSWAVEAGQSLVYYFAGEAQEGEAAKAWLADITFAFSDIDSSELPSCWGLIHAKDVTPPTLECPPDTDVATFFTSVQEINGSLDAQDPQLNTALYSCLIDNFTENGERFYELTEFEVSEAGIYTFILTADFTAGDADMALFQGSFNLLSPCTNIIGQADFPQAGNPLGGDEPFLRLSLPLRPEQPYFLLTTSDEIGATGDYRYAVLSQGDGTLDTGTVANLPLTFPLFCEDLSLIEGTDSLQWTGLPQLEDNCSTPSLSLNEVSETIGDCGAIALRRFFRAEDDAGNVSNCAQRIDFRRPTIEDVSLPPFTAPIECDEDFPLDEFGGPSPDFTGYPFVITAQGIRDLREGYCNLGATYQDGPSVDLCFSSFQFVRTWTIVDWCDPTNTETYAQIIKVGDFTAPEISCPVIDVDGDGFPDPPIYPTAPFECTAAFPVPMPQVNDNCSNWEVAVEIVTDRDSLVFNEFGQVVDTVAQTVVLASLPAGAPNKMVSGIPIGCHRFRYLVSDECGNATVRECGFCVEDRSDPVATCDDDLTASIGLDGNLRLFAANVNEGSWDNCGIDSLSVRRRVTLDDHCQPVTPFFTPWASFVEFSCCELNSSVVIELLAMDAAGNANVCTTEVFIEDKALPDCLPPEDVTVPCNQLPADFQADSLEQLGALFGIPEAADNCSADWEELPPVNELGECGFGTLIRRFRAVDESGNTSEGPCQQRVTVEAVHDYKIRFPKDAEANCGNPNPDTTEWTELGCDLLAISVADTFFSASGSACYKVFRTHRVINWCEYDGASDPVRIGRDEDCDEHPGDEEVWVVRQPDQAFVDRDAFPGNSVPAAGTKGNVCDGSTNPAGYWRPVASNGFWEYKQHLLVYDTVAPQIEFPIPPPICSNNNETCRAPAEYPFVITDNCTPNDLDIQVFYDEFSDGTIDSVLTDVFGSYPKYKLSGDYPIGMHEFEIVVEDGCGNVASAVLPLEIVDCKAPAPACLNGISLSLMPVFPQTDIDGDGDIDKGVATVFAEDLIASDYVDCSMPLTYTINRAGETPNIEQDSLVVTCDDLGALIVEVYAWDAAGNPYAVQPDSTVGGPNYDFCETFVVVGENIVDCGSDLPMIAGTVARQDSALVSEVEVQIMDGLDQVQLTDTTGRYAFEDLPSNHDFTVTPRKDGDDLNGLSTFDIALINKHILGIQTIESPYILIAADVNNSGTVTTLDLIHLRQVLLSVMLEFPHSDSWRFVPKSYEFPDPLSPWKAPIPSSLQYESLQGANMEEDYVAIKVGDIDLSASFHVHFPPAQAEERHGLAHWLELADKLLSPGKVLEVPVYSKLSGTLGLQGVLRWDTNSVEVQAVEPGYLAEGNFNAADLRHGRLPMSWNAEQPPEQRTRLLTLRLRARSAASLSDVLRLAPYSALQPEAYDQAGRAMDLKLKYEAEALPAAVFSPNPFWQEAQLRFALPFAQKARFSLYTLAGELLFTEERYYGAGEQVWTLAGEKMPGGGVFLLRLETENKSWVGRILHME